MTLMSVSWCQSLQVKVLWIGTPHAHTNTTPRTYKYHIKTPHHTHTNTTLHIQIPHHITYTQTLHYTCKYHTIYTQTHNTTHIQTPHHTHKYHNTHTNTTPPTHNTTYTQTPHHTTHTNITPHTNTTSHTNTTPQTNTTPHTHKHHTTCTSTSSHTTYHTHTNAPHHINTGKKNSTRLTSVHCCVIRTVDLCEHVCMFFVHLSFEMFFYSIFTRGHIVYSSNNRDQIYCQKIAFVCSKK